MRAQRRRQLELEKKGVESQLDTLVASRARLEAAIASSDAISYQRAGVGPGAGQSQTIGPTLMTMDTRVGRRKVKRHRTH